MSENRPRSTYEFSKVVDGFPQQCSDAQIMRATDEIFLGLFVEVDAGEVQQGSLVIRHVVGFDLRIRNPLDD